MPRSRYNFIPRCIRPVPRLSEVSIFHPSRSSHLPAELIYKYSEPFSSAGPQRDAKCSIVCLQLIEPSQPSDALHAAQPEKEASRASRPCAFALIYHSFFFPDDLLGSGPGNPVLGALDENRPAAGFDSTRGVLSDRAIGDVSTTGKSRKRRMPS